MGGRSNSFAPPQRTRRRRVFSHRWTQMHTDKEKRKAADECRFAQIRSRMDSSYLCASVPHLWLILFVLIIAAPVRGGTEGPWRVPVLEIRYFPVTGDGKKIDIAVTSNVGRRCRRFGRNVIG